MTNTPQTEKTTSSRRYTHTMFDIKLPEHIDNLYSQLKSVYDAGTALISSDHSCNCEYCEVDEDSELLDENRAAYNKLYSQSLDIALTMRQCLRWADFKGVEITSRNILHINRYTLDNMGSL